MEQSTSNKILCFGELLLHFAPDSEGNWLDNQSLKVYVGGAEYNVAFALASWKNQVSLLSALPENDLGNQLQNQLEKNGISVLADKSNGRLGTFYLPYDGDMQNAKVIYDRFPSVFTESDFSNFKNENLFKNVGWLHISTITPALSENAFQKCLELMKFAASNNIKVSLDLNYRAALWKDKNPYEKVNQLLPYVSLLMGNIWSIQEFLKINIELNLNGKFDDENLLKQAEKSAQEIQKIYPNVTWIANTFRFTEGDEVNYFATLFTDNQLLISEQHYSDKIEEKVGSGDSFVAALIHGLLKSEDSQTVLNNATKVAFKKLFVKGDTINETISIDNL